MLACELIRRPFKRNICSPVYSQKTSTWPKAIEWAVRLLCLVSHGPCVAFIKLEVAHDKGHVLQQQGSMAIEPFNGH
jgi:hypothetical protein